MQTGGGSECCHIYCALWSSAGAPSTSSKKVLMVLNEFSPSSLRTWIIRSRWNQSSCCANTDNGFPFYTQQNRCGVCAFTATHGSRDNCFFREKPFHQQVEPKRCSFAALILNMSHNWNACESWSGSFWWFAYCWRGKCGSAMLFRQRWFLPCPKSDTSSLLIRYLQINCGSLEILGAPLSAMAPPHRHWRMMAGVTGIGRAALMLLFQ